MLRDRSSWTTAKVKHRRASGKPGNETVVPNLVVPGVGLTIMVPLGGVLLVLSDNPISKIRHHEKVGGSSRVC
jgi:hypothetical protein